MTDEEAESGRLNLVTIIAETGQMLLDYGEAYWTERLDDSRTLIESRDFRGVDQLFSYFGGMGSFSDLLIHPLNGHKVDNTQVDAANDMLRTLRSRIYELVIALRQYEYAR